MNPDLRAMLSLLRKEATLVTDYRRNPLPAAKTILPCIVRAALRSLLYHPSSFATEMLDLYYPAYVNYDARKIQGFDSYELKEREATHEQMRFMISRIVDTVSVELTQSKYASLAAFVRRSQNWETPTISITTDALFRLEAAIQSTECPGHKACHFLLYLFVVAYHEIGHLLGRYVHGTQFKGTPEHARAACHSRAPANDGEGGEIIEEKAFGSLLELSHGRIVTKLESSTYKILPDDVAATTLSFLLLNINAPSPYQSNIPIFATGFWLTPHSSRYNEMVNASQEKEDAQGQISLSFSDFFDILPTDFPPNEDADLYEIDRARQEAKEGSNKQKGRDTVIQELAKRRRPTSPLQARSSRQEPSADSETSFSAPILRFPEIVASLSKSAPAIDDTLPSARLRPSCIVDEPVPFTQAQLDAVRQG